MTDVIQPKHASLWREGFRLFRAHWKEWSKWAVWFFVILSLFQVLMMHALAGLDNANSMQKTGGHLTPEQKQQFFHMILQAVWWMIPFVIVTIVQTYVFIAFFMKRQPEFGAVELSIGGFFKWMWRYLQLLFLLAAVAMVVIGIPFGVMALNISPVLLPVAFIVAFAGFVFVYFLALRFMAVMTLVVCNVEPLFKTSWIITKGNCWRLVGNLLLMMLILFGILIGVGLVEGIIMGVVSVLAEHFYPHAADDADSIKSVSAQVLFYVQTVLGALNMTVFNGILWAFYCAATRVFYDEKRQADPGFVLSFRP